MGAQGKRISASFRENNDDPAASRRARIHLESMYIGIKAFMPRKVASEDTFLFLIAIYNILLSKVRLRIATAINAST